MYKRFPPIKETEIGKGKHARVNDGPGVTRNGGRESNVESGCACDSMDKCPQQHQQLQLRNMSTICAEVTDPDCVQSGSNFRTGPFTKRVRNVPKHIARLFEPFPAG